MRVNIKTIFFAVAALIFVASTYELSKSPPGQENITTPTLSVWEGIVNTPIQGGWGTTEPAGETKFFIETSSVKLWETALIIATFIALFIVFKWNPEAKFSYPKRE